MRLVNFYIPTATIIAKNLKNRIYNLCVSFYIRASEISTIFMNWPVLLSLGNRLIASDNGFIFLKTLCLSFNYLFV